ncbi:hypothetical protein PRIPAC_73359 [Pristionchus pacificus]|uniref:Uncharacterized protein n=1 Tax=Pristionchus pacificus TaxID=54126 RepID=A0A8R1U7Z7_PRIPA|nr:hypothetical protein PRIPAC_73359 [Pristionchus pacificus]|eukprot:PDM73361.1 hypothetical protein PRIPAC_40717 [Pristionchus pacificus]
MHISQQASAPMNPTIKENDDFSVEKVPITSDSESPLNEISSKENNENAKESKPGSWRPMPPYTTEEKEIILNQCRKWLTELQMTKPTRKPQNDMLCARENYEALAALLPHRSKSSIQTQVCKTRTRGGFNVLLKEFGLKEKKGST